MGNNALWEAVVDVFRGSLVRAQVGARRGTEETLLHQVKSDCIHFGTGLPPGSEPGAPFKAHCEVC